MNLYLFVVACCVLRVACSGYMVVCLPADVIIIVLRRQ